MTDSALSIIIAPETLRSQNTAALNPVAYTAVGTPLANAVRLVKFTNNGLATVFVSWDGVNDHEIVPPNSFALLDVTSNKAFDGGFFIPKGIQFFIRGIAGAGTFYISTYYGIYRGI